MDELLEVMVGNHLGEINKPVGVLNINGYYDSFFEWLRKSVEEEFVSQENLDRVLISSDVSELLEMILTAQMPSLETWMDRLNVEPIKS